MAEPIAAERLAEIEACERETRDGPWILADANDGDGTPPFWVISTPEDADDDWSVAIHIGDRGVGAFIEMARTAVPELLAEVARLKAHLAEYVGWEPTVKEEYEHACAVAERTEAVVKRFEAGDFRGEVGPFLSALKHALEMI
jgi:hypothetical protein